MATRFRELVLPWLQQPQEATRVDPDHPLADGLVVAWIGSIDDRNLVNGLAATGAGTGESRVSSPDGLGLSFTGSGTGKRQWVTPAEQAAVSFVFLASLSSTNSLGRPVSNYNGRHDVYTDSGSLYFQSFRTGSAGQWARASAADNAPHVYVITYDGASTANNAALFVDGVELALTKNVSPSGSLVSASSYFAVGGRPDVTSRQMGGQIYAAMRWDRALSAAQVKELSDALWSLFEPQRIWVPVSAGGGAGITGPLISRSRLTHSPLIAGRIVQ